MTHSAATTITARTISAEVLIGKFLWRPRNQLLSRPHFNRTA
jgi:hypothetical protein